MAVRGFNWKFLIVIVIGLAMLTATAFCLHKWQKNRMAMGSFAGGNKAYALGQWEQAASDLGKYIAVTGRTDVPVLLKYADAQLKIRPLSRDNVQQAVLAYKSILRLQPGNYEASTRLIRLYLEMGMYGESELTARRALEGVQDLTIRRMLVMALVGQQKFKEASAELNAIIQDHPDDNESCLLLAMTYDKTGQQRQAIALYREALSRSPRDLRIIMPAVTALCKSGEYDEADIPAVKFLHEKDPNDTDIAIYLASLYMHGGDYKAAFSVLDRQLAICDPNARIKINIQRAVILHRSGDNAHANELLKSLAHDDPNDSAVMLAEAGLLKDEQKWDELAEYVGRWHQDHSESTNAVVAVSKNLSADPNNAARTAAEKILKNAIAADQNSPELVNELAGLLYASGRSVEAMQQYQKLLKLDPDNLTAINNLAWIMCETQGEYARALELAQNGLRISPDYLDLIDTRGMAYFRLGRIDKAIEDFTRCAKSYPSYASSTSVSYFHLGRAYATLTKKDEAVKYLKLALESNQKVGGLSANDASETQNLLDSLLKG